MSVVALPLVPFTALVPLCVQEAAAAAAGKPAHEGF